MKFTSRQSCPECGQKGKKLQSITPQSLLTPSALSRLGPGTLRFCRSESCDMIYFDEAHQESFVARDLKVPIFQKSSDPERPVCYCFSHSVRSIEEEIAGKGTSEVADDIGNKCKAGLDDCARNNPQGSCCLANVRKVIKAALEAYGGIPGSSLDSGTGCCDGKNSPEVPTHEPTNQN